eukprot:scaffold82419_cov54-Phaeocystis_antarctica.AAC.3
MTHATAAGGSGCDLCSHGERPREAAPALRPVRGRRGVGERTEGSGPHKVHPLLEGGRVEGKNRLSLTTTDARTIKYAYEHVHNVAHSETEDNRASVASRRRPPRPCLKGRQKAQIVAAMAPPALC